MNCKANTPRELANAEERERRQAMLAAAHMTALRKYTEGIRKSTGKEIPDFDPCDGGVDAEALFLLEAPGPKAIKTGFVSRNNPDATAENMLRTQEAAGLARERTILWNIIPWATPKKAGLRSEVEKGKAHLAALIGLLPELKAIVLVGLSAQRAKAEIMAMTEAEIFCSYHPSPLNVNTRPEMRQKILDIFCHAHAYLERGN